MMSNESVLKDGETVRVGETEFVVSRSASMLMMIGKLEVTDPRTGEKAIFRTPTPGWRAIPREGN
jgi:hypothetical protein